MQPAALKPPIPGRREGGKGRQRTTTRKKEGGESTPDRRPGPSAATQHRVRKAPPGANIYTEGPTYYSSYKHCDAPALAGCCPQLRGGATKMSRNWAPICSRRQAPLLTESQHVRGGARFVRPAPARAQESATRYAQGDVQIIEATLDEMLLKTGVSQCRQAADL